MITGRENYKRAIEFGSPERLPVGVDCMFDWLWEKDEAKVARIKEIQSRFPLEIVHASCFHNRPGLIEKGDNARHWLDEWGTGWEDDGHGAKTETYPMEEGYHLFDTITWPDANEPDRWKHADGLLSQRGESYFLGHVWFTFFERLWMLRGFNNMLMDPYQDTDNFCRLRDKVLEVNLAMIDKWVERKVDGVFFSDDWGCQRGLLMNPEDWRKFYKPSYKAMFQRVRDGGANVWMHLCGNVIEIIPDLLDCGLNVLNPVQPQAMDVHYLAREFGGKLCFNGGVDVQGTLINGTPEEVKREVHELVRIFGGFNGGYIGGTSHSIMPETPLDNVLALYEAFAEYLTARPQSPDIPSAIVM